MGHNTFAWLGRVYSTKKIVSLATCGGQSRQTVTTDVELNLNLFFLFF